MNVFDLPRLPLSGELTTVLLESSAVRVERIVSTGQVSDWYDQAEAEFVFLVEGSAVIEFANNKIVDLSKGDTLIIEPHERHRVCFTSIDPPCIWLCVFY